MTGTFTDRSKGSRRVRFISLRTSEKVARVRMAADKSLKAGWAEYEKEFRVKHTSPTIDKKHTSALSQAINQGDAVVTIPIEVSLALWLRSGGGGRPSGPTPIDYKALKPVMLNALRWKAKLKEDNRKRPAGERELEAAAKFRGQTPIKSDAEFVRVMNHRKWWDPDRG